MFKVLVNFYDFSTNKSYKAGDEYPSSAPKKRLADLSAKDSPNRALVLKGKPIIEEIKTVKEDKK